MMIYMLLGCLLTGCEAQRALLKPSLRDQGQVFLYVQAFPQTADRLKFSLAQVSAVKDDGSQYPLHLAIADFNSSAFSGQRLFASGELPPGDYTALAISVSRATLLDEEGEEKLLVPEKPVQIDCRFVVMQRKAAFLSLAFRYDQAVTGGYSFSPVFSCKTSGKPVAGLTGYVSNYGSNTLTVFDKQSYQVVGVIATGAGPRGMALDQVRRRAYVALAGDNAVEIFDISTGDTINRIRLKPGDVPQEMALSADGRLLLVVNSGSNTVSFVDPVSCIETGRVAVGDTPTSIVVDPAGLRAYVFNDFSQTISVIDIASRAVAATAPSEPGRSRGQFNRKGDILYTIHEMSPFLRLVNPFSLGMQQRYQVGMGTTAIKVDSLTNLIYTGKKFGSEVQVYEPSTFVPISTIPTGGSPLFMAIDGELNNLFVINDGNREVEVVNLITREVVGRFDAGDSPSWISIMGER